MLPMCELFGASILTETSLNGILSEFFSHSVIHPHGWGLATFKPNCDIPNIVKEPTRAVDSLLLKQTLLQDINQSVVLGHIRYATIGKIDVTNCHPYTYRDRFNHQWTLIHNGTIYADRLLIPYESIQQGSSDSERVLLHIINRVNQYDTPPNTQEIFHALDNLVCELSYRNKLNLIFYDGRMLYVHTNMKHTLYQKTFNGNLYFSTVPLDQGEWLPVPMNTLLAYQNGTLAYRGTNHRHEFIDPYTSIPQTQDYYI
jgi:glutamine amidotransferase